MLLRIRRLPFTERYYERCIRRLIVSVELGGGGPVLLVVPGIENGSDPDKMPAGRHTLIMTRMATSKTRALWLPGTELFGHPANSPDQLKGCWAIGEMMRSYGVADSRAAFSDLFGALGGWEEGHRVECLIEE